MTAVIFAGPSLAVAATLPDGVLRLPPARLGDVARAALAVPPPAIIGLVDGLFEGEPPPRHKEILWALSQGIRVLGASSIGALRAAELARYGMEPVGVVAAAFIAEGFAGLPFGDDDEVAVLHGPAELGYPATSEAMVNIRATIAVALSAGVISRGTTTALVVLAKRRFFKERSFETLLSDARAGRLPEAELTAFAGWLPRGRVDQKAADAHALVERIATLLQNPEPAPPPNFVFEATESWLELVEAIAPGSSESGERGASIAELEETLLLDPELRRRILRRVLDDLLERREAQRRGLAADDWRALLDLYMPLLLRRLPEALGDSEDWRELLQRIDRRRRVLARYESLPTLAECGETEASLVAWHAARHGLAWDGDVERQAERLGFGGGDALIAALLRLHLTEVAHKA
jgi:hypothetical protein